MNQTKPTNQQITTTAHLITTLNPQQPCDSSHGVYLPDDVDGYDRNNDSNHDCPVDVVACNHLLLQRIATDPEGCGGSWYS